MRLWLVFFLLSWHAAAAWSAGPTAQYLQRHATRLPSELLTELQRIQVPPEAISIVVQEVGRAKPVLAVNEERPMNPASLAKLLTTYAALDQLGPAWTWSTPVWLQGRIADGVLEGQLVIRGSGDPTLVIEQVWLMLRRVQQLGVREIRGDIVLDGSAFAVPGGDPADFDGEPHRPYNVQPDALMLNYKSVIYDFVPDAASRRARIGITPALSGAEAAPSVPLADGPCGDWRGALKASAATDGTWRFAGGYPNSCGARSWPLADPQPQTYNARMIAALWREMGGRLSGRVREGPAPMGEAPTFEHLSPSLAEVVRDINKYSNNTMAQQLFYTLAATAQPGQPASADAARARVRQWLQAQVGELAREAVVDNGSGLSRENRVSARLLARLLQQAFASPVMPELMASLPVAGLDGTMRRSRATPGRAHLKTGSLRDTAGVAGYVLSDSGRRYVLVALVNHPNAGAGRPALDALLQWVMRDAPQPAEAAR